MCLFSYHNKQINSKAYRKGVEKFECGGCPECMAKKARQWALRCAMEAKSNVGMMVTLTYDSYEYNNNGEIIGEKLNADIELSKTDCQKFIKRLREKFPDKPIKYLLTAERGKRTNRPHYHALIFGVVFDDLRLYKKSKRGNYIYRSKTLEKLWHGGYEKKGGICTVDCVNLSAKTARYCTKYCAKDNGADDTFMLFSRGIGEEELLRRFNGKSYWIDGREYSIPRQIWDKYIERKYNLQGFSRYKNKVHIYDLQKHTFYEIERLEKQKRKWSFLYKKFFCTAKNLTETRIFAKTAKNTFMQALFKKRRISIDKEYFNKLLSPDIAHERSLYRREIFINARDNDPVYKRYIAYWKRKNEVSELARGNDLERIMSLPDVKYRGYKQKAILAKMWQKSKCPFVPPRSNSSGFCGVSRKKEYVEKSFAYISRHYTANDSFFEIKFKQLQENKENGYNQPWLSPIFDDHAYINPFIRHYSYIYSKH